MDTSQVVTSEFNVEQYLEELYTLKDKYPQYKYITMNKPMNKAITDYLFTDNKYKATLQELSGLTVVVSSLIKNQETPKAFISVLDLNKIAVVNGNFNDEEVYLDDLFNMITNEW